MTNGHRVIFYLFINTHIRLPKELSPVTCGHRTASLSSIVSGPNQGPYLDVKTEHLFKDAWNGPKTKGALQKLAVIKNKVE